MHSIVFVGINFYARDNVGAEAKRSLDEMFAASYALGIDYYWGSDISGVRIIDHSVCFYDNVPLK